MPSKPRVEHAGALYHVKKHYDSRTSLIPLAFKMLARGRITLGGNLESRVLENEYTDTVEEATRRAFEGGKARMVLKTTAGPISEMTRRMIANYHRIIDVWEELSLV